MTRVGEWFRDHITVHHKPAETDDGLHGELIVSGPSLDAVRNWVSGAYPDAVLVSWSRYGLTGRCVRGMFVPNPDQDLADLAADALAFLAAAATTSAGSATIPVIAAAAAEPKPSRATRKKAEQAEQAESSTVSTRDTARDSVCDDSWSADAFALLNSIGIEFGQHVDPLPAGQDNDVRFSVPLRHTHPTPTPEPARPARPAVRRELVSTSRAPKPPEPAPAYGSPRRAALPSQVAAAGLGEQQETILVDTLSAAAAAGRPEEPPTSTEELTLAQRLLEEESVEDVVLPEGPRFADLLAGLQNFPEGLLTDTTPDTELVAKPRIPQRRPAGLQR